MKEWLWVNQERLMLLKGMNGKDHLLFLGRIICSSLFMCSLMFYSCEMSIEESSSEPERSACYLLALFGRCFFLAEPALPLRYASSIS